MKKIILSILTILILFPASVFAETVGFFSKIEGRVDILKEGAARAASINLNDPVSLGDIVRTKSDGKAEITFRDDSTVRIASESRLKIDEYAFNPDNTRSKGVLNLFRGKIRAVVSKTRAIIPVAFGESTFNVNTPTAVAGVRGSGLFVFHDRGITGVIFTDGSGFVYNPNVPERIVPISAGQVTFVTKPDAPPTPPRPATNVELAVHTKDTAPQEKPKEKKEEGDKQKEDKKEVKEAKAEDKDKKDEGKKDEKAPTEEAPKTVEAAPAAAAAEQAAPVDINAAVGEIASSALDIASSSTSIETLTTSDGTVFGFTAPTETILTAIAEIVTTAETTLDGALDPSIVSSYSCYTDASGNTTCQSQAAAGETGATSITLADITLTDTSTLPPPPTPDAFIGLIYPDNSGYPSYCLYNCGNFGSLPWNDIYTKELTQDGYMDGVFAGIDSFWTGPAAFYAAGAYSNPNNKPLWFAITEGLVADGSAFYGYTSGINLYNYLEGGLIAIYIKPDGTTGYLTSNNATGFFDPANGIWAATGTLTSLQKGSTYVPPSELYDYSPYLDYGYNYGDIGGDIAGNVSIEDTSIIDQNWGIWIGYGGGSFGALPAQNWTAKIGGDTYDDYYVSFDGYWLGNISGTEWLNGKLKGNVSGRFLSKFELGQFDGKVLGVYDAYGNWHADSLGTYTETPLAFVSAVSSNLNAVTNYYDGSLSALLGGTTSLWSGSGVPVTMMGSYNPSTAEPHLFSTDIYSYNYNNSTNTTYDTVPGAYYGFTAGTEINNVMDGRLYALYIDPNGAAGYLKGSMTGAAYPDINMFEMDGTIDRISMPNTTGLTADQLYNNIWFGGGVYGYLSGDFGGSGSITGIDNGLYTYSLVNYATNTPELWGIYNHEFTGNFSNPGAGWTAKLGGYDGFGAYYDGSYFNNDYGYWLMDATAGTWSGDKLTASVNGKYLTPYKMGNITGEMLGTYNTANGVWQGIGMGAYDGTPLDFSGNVYGGLLWYDPATYPGVLRYANTDPYDQTPNVQGIIGGVGNPWTTGSTNVYLMGTYSAYSGAEPYLVYGSGWHLNYDPTVSGYPSTIGGAFSGYTVGLWNNGAIDTKTLTIYIAPNGSAGYLSGPLSGNYYSGVNIWEMSGTLSTEFVETTTIFPADLAASLNTGGFGWYCPTCVALSGDFGGSGGIASTYIEGSLKGLAGLNWGIWNSGMGGSYTGQSGTNMSAKLGGSSFFYYPDTYSNGYMLGDIASNDWGIYGSTFSGSMNAQFMTPYLLGNMTGDVVGTYDGTYWQSAGIGKWDATPLVLSGQISAGYYYYDDFNNYLDYSFNYYNGIYGTTESAFASPGTPVTLYAMGDTSPYGYSTWWNSIEGNNYVDTTSHWFGWTGGTTNPVTNAEKGMLKALYIDAGGNAGILTGDFNGSYYPALSMWDAQGTLTANQKVAAGVYDPALFWNYVDYSYPEGLGYGNFAGGTGYVQLGDYLQWIYYNETATYWLVNPNTSNPEPWGVYKLELGGYYDNPSSASTFSMDIGGYDWKGYWTGDTDYWLANISGNWNADQTIDGTVTGRYLTPYALGTITGNMLGSYDTYTAGTWEGVVMGEWTEQHLAFVSAIYGDLWHNSGEFGSPAWVSTQGVLNGLMGSVDSLWGAGPVPVTIMGSYNAYNISYIWGSPFSLSYNYYNSTNTTYDGGSYVGYFNALELENSNDINIAKFRGMFIDPSGNAGFLTSDLTGKSYPDINMFELNGNISKIAMETGTPRDITYWWANFDNTFETVGITDFLFDGSLMGVGASPSRPYEYWGNYHVTLDTFDKNWGMQDTTIYGSYSGITPTDNWNWSMEYKGPAGGTDWIVHGMEYTGAKWSDNIIQGTALGYGASLSLPTVNTPQTWISVGETFGYYNPLDTTFHAVQTGMFIETSKFLAMADPLNPAYNPAALTALNIPFVEVGRANLSGTGNNMPTVNMNDVTFFAYSGGAAPKIWATNNVTGTYTAPPVLNIPVTLTGNGISTDFTVKQWDTTSGNWLSTVNGGGTCSGCGSMDGTAIQMNGAAAGTGATATSGAITGTAAGVAK